MSFIEMDGLEDVTEAKPVPEGEYNLTIEDVTEKEKDGRMSGLLIKHSIEGASDDTAPVFYNLTIPAPDCDPDKRKNILLFNKRYLTLFNINFAGGIDPASMLGKRAKCKLKLEEYEGAMSNKIVVPAIK